MWWLSLSECCRNLPEWPVTGVTSNLCSYIQLHCSTDLSALPLQLNNNKMFLALNSPPRHVYDVTLHNTLSNSLSINMFALCYQESWQPTGISHVCLCVARETNRLGSLFRKSCLFFHNSSVQSHSMSACFACFCTYLCKMLLPDSLGGRKQTFKVFYSSETWQVRLLLEDEVVLSTQAETLLEARDLLEARGHVADFLQHQLLKS